MSKRLLIKITLFCFMFLCFGFFFCFRLQVNAESLPNQEDVNLYIDDDTLIESRDYKIFDYPDLIATRGAVAKRGGFMGGFEYQYIGIDDPIVEIVPKSFFYTECSEAVLGEEYGFYIKTTSTSKENKIYYSTVLVFDVNTDTDLVKNEDRVIVKIEPLFQYNYLCLKESGVAHIHGFVMDYSVNEPWVIPYPSKMQNTTFDYSLEYNMEERYYIKDISFGASLFNEQTLNKGDESYNPYDDYGSYFTGFDYSYSGKHRVKDGFSGEDLGWNIADTIMYGLGYLDVIPVIGSVTAVIGQIYDTVSLVNNWTTFGVDTYIGVNGSIKQIEKKITATCYYQNRDDQLKYYRDKDNNSYLIKTAALGINTDDNDSIWYGINDNVTGYFNINHSALNGRSPEYTRFTNHIVLKIVDSSGETVVTTVDKITTNHLREKTTKDLTLEKEELVYLLPNGFNSYSFIAPFSSDYNIQINTTEAMQVTINGTKYSGSKINISTLIHAGDELYIKTDGNSKISIGKIKISPNSNRQNISIANGEQYLLCIDSLSGLKELSINNTNVVIDKIFYMSNYKLVSYENYGTISPDDIISYPFKTHTKFYVVLHNKTSNLISNVVLSINDIRSLTIGNQTDVNLYPNMTYFKLNALEGGQYIQTITNISDKNFVYKVLDSNLNVIPNGYSYTSGEFIMTFDSDKTYYIGITNGNDCRNAKLIINSRSNAYQWEIIGGQYTSGYKTFDRSIRLKRGYTYTLKFWINNQISDTSLFSEDDPNNYYGGYNISVNSNGTLSIPTTAPIGGSGITIKAKYYNTDASYDHTLKVIPEFENTISNLSCTNNDDLSFSFQSPRYVKSFDYKISIGSLSKNFSMNISNYSSSNYVEKSILDDYKTMNYTGVGNITINITKLYVSTAINGTSSYNCNFTVSVHNLFASGTGTSNDPYLIACYRHLNNIRNLSSDRISGCFKLINNIYCPDSSTGYYWDASWEILPNFFGTFDGNSCQIIRSNIVINKDDSYTDSEQGLFRVNYGTIKNLTLYDSGTFTYYQEGFDPNKIIYSGMFCGSNYGTIENCAYRSNDNSMCFFVPRAYVGGITGWNAGRIKYCTVQSVNISGFGHKGGIAGYNDSIGTIENCQVYGKIINRYRDAEQEDQYSVGGIVGINHGDLYNCSNYAKIEFWCSNTPTESRTLQPRMGLFIGTNYGSYESCRNYGSVDTTGLQTVKWTTGSLWWKEEHIFYQTLYCGGYCGEDLNV